MARIAACVSHNRLTTAQPRPRICAYREHVCRLLAAAGTNSSSLSGLPCPPSSPFITRPFLDSSRKAAAYETAAQRYAADRVGAPSIWTRTHGTLCEWSGRQGSKAGQVTPASSTSALHVSYHSTAAIYVNTNISSDVPLVFQSFYGFSRESTVPIFPWSGSASWPCRDAR
jgi:hypothetical protein